MRQRHKKQTKQSRATKARKARQAERREREALTAVLARGETHYRIPPSRAAQMPIEALRKEAKRRGGFKAVKRPMQVAALQNNLGVLLAMALSDRAQER